MTTSDVHTRETIREILQLASKFSWDTWAVLAAFLAALLIRLGVVKHIPW